MIGSEPPYMFIDLALTPRPLSFSCTILTDQTGKLKPKLRIEIPKRGIDSLAPLTKNTRKQTYRTVHTMTPTTLHKSNPPIENMLLL